MSKLHFLTPVTYKPLETSNKTSLLEKVDNYFYLGGKKAHVISERSKKGHEKVILLNNPLIAATKIENKEKIIKILSYSTGVIPLIMLIVKAILRSQHSFKVIDPQKKLEKGIEISDISINTIQQLIPTIINKQDDDSIEWVQKGHTLVFKLKESPQIIYKIGISSPSSTKRNSKKFNPQTYGEIRYANMIQAKAVCLFYGLGLLIVPKATKFNVKVEGITYTIIAEELLDIVPNESAQEEFFHKYSLELNETVRQLATFIAKTGFNDVNWRNIPIINENPEYHGQRKIAIIDTEHFNHRLAGIIGSGLLLHQKDELLDPKACGIVKCRGLVGCVSKEQVDIVITEAKKQGVAIPRKYEKKVRKYRFKDIEEDDKLRLFYVQRGVVDGKEPIQVELDTLGLDLTAEDKLYIEGKFITYNFRQVAEDVIARINNQINNSSDLASIKKKRYIEFNKIYNIVFSIYSDLRSVSEDMEEDEENHTWLDLLLNALKDKGYIYKFKSDSNGYFIQA